MNVGDFLPAVLAFIYHQSIPLLQVLQFRDFGSSDQQFPQNGLVLLLGLRNPGEAVLVLGNDEDVCRCNWCDVPEGEDEVVLVDHFARNLLSDEFVENGLLCHLQDLL